MRCRVTLWLLGVVSCSELALTPIGRGPVGGDDDPTTTLGDCRLPNPAFCETFETVHVGGTGGDLDERRWAVSRVGLATSETWLRSPATAPDDRIFPPTFCGTAFSGIVPPNDARVCPGTGVDGVTSGQLNEVLDDQGVVGINDLRIRQPFDFEERQGVIALDVDAKSNPLSGGHGWWIELWLTEEPMPVPHRPGFGILSPPRNGLGIRFGTADCPQDDGWRTGVADIIIVRNYEIDARGFGGLETPDDRCFTTGDAQLNHVEVHVSRERVEVLVSDLGDGQNARLRAALSDLALPFTRGYVHLQHAQFSAVSACSVDPPQCSTPVQTYRWDNVGFDGPILPTPRGFDVPDPLLPGSGSSVSIGWIIIVGGARSVTIPDVDPTGAQSASLSLALIAWSGQVIEYRLNGGPTHTWTYPPIVGEPGGLMGIVLPVPVDELVPGDNTLELAIDDRPEVVESFGSVGLSIE